MIKTICQVKKIVQPGSFYVCWSGVSTGVSNDMIRADMLFLNVVFKYDEETYFRRIRGHKEYGDSGPHILWTLKNRYRITNGERRGMLVPIKDVRDEETFVESGVSKVLRTGSDSKRLSKERKGDVAIAKLLGNMEEHIHVDSLDNLLPDLYLTCKPNNNQLHLRRVGKVQKILLEHPEYSSLKNSDDNLRALKEHYQISVGADRIGYPFSMVYGGGVMAAAVDSKNTSMLLGQWYKVKHDSLAMNSLVEGVSIEGDLQDALNNCPHNK